MKKITLTAALLFLLYGGNAQTVTLTPQTATQCAGEIQQLTASAGAGTGTLFSENFEGTALGNFTATVISGTVNSNSQWTNRNSPYTPTTTVWHPVINSGSHFALSNSDYSGAVVNTALESGVLNTTGYTSLSLQFRHYYSDYSTSDTGDFAYIETSIDGGTTWTAAQTYSTTQGAPTNFASVTLNLDAFINVSTFKFRFRYKAAWNDGWAIDDVVLSGPGSSVTGFVWSPIAGLYSDAAATVAYTGAAAASVYASPEESTTYTASYTSDTDMYSGSTVITVTNTSPPVIEESIQSFCHQAVLEDIAIDGENISWYESPTGGAALPANTPLENNEVYYAARTADGCESTLRSEVTIVISNPSAPVLESNTVSFCNTATVGDLENGEEDYIWYASASGNDFLPPDAPLENGQSYFASKTESGCESLVRAELTVTITVVNAPTGDSAQTIEVNAGEEAIMDDIIVAGDGGSIIWYPTEEDALNGTNAIAMETAIVSGSEYFAVQVTDGCTSTDMLAVIVDVVLGNGHFDMTSLSYHPNPVSDVLTISCSSEITSVTIFNMLGQKVLSVQPDALQVKVNTSNFAGGTYLVNVMVGESVKLFKIVKKL